MSKDSDVERLKPLIIERLEAEPDAWLGEGQIAYGLYTGEHVLFSDALKALQQLVADDKIEHVRRPSDGCDVYRAKRSANDPDMWRRVIVLEAEFQNIIERFAELSRTVEDRTGPPSDRD
jgi:hypothetical protein